MSGPHFERGRYDGPHGDEFIIEAERYPSTDPDADCERYRDEVDETEEEA